MEVMSKECLQLKMHYTSDQVMAMPKACRPTECMQGSDLILVCPRRSFKFEGSKGSTYVLQDLLTSTIIQVLSQTRVSMIIQVKVTNACTHIH